MLTRISPRLALSVVLVEELKARHRLHNSGWDEPEQTDCVSELLRLLNDDPQQLAMLANQSGNSYEDQEMQLADLLQ